MSRLTDARGELERYEQTKPADYQSKYQGQINDVMSKLNDRGASWNATSRQNPRTTRASIRDRSMM